MRFHEIINERASAVLYHYTSTYFALKILSTGEFALSSVTGNPSEQRYAPKGYPYFLSLARTSLGDYHRYTGTSGVLFVLDGDWFNSRYIVKPMDYWERSWQHSPGRTREAEDRVFSKEPTIPTTPITAVHVVLKGKDEYRGPRTRQLMIVAKQRGLPVYLYTDEKAWRLLDTRRAVPLGAASDLLKGPQPISNYTRKPTDYLKPWIELIEKNQEGHLSERAKKLLKTLMWYNYPGEDQHLGVDLSNARTPNSGDRESAVKLIRYMQKNGYDNDTVKLKNDISKKWSAMLYPKESLGESISPMQQDLKDVAEWMNTAPDNLSITVKQEPIEKFIKQIREMYGTYDEFPEDEQRTNSILKLLKRGAKPMPIYVESGDPDLFVMEGRHRMVAFWLAGMKTVSVAYVSVSKGNGVVGESDATLSYQGNCTQDDVIEDIFGDVNNFAQLVEEHGDEFTIGDLVVKYDEDTDIHSFYYKL